MGRFDAFKSNNPFRQHNDNDNVNDVPPPPGPPPSHQITDYAPPPGPPPSYTTANPPDYAPTPGPPPSHHNWQDAVPDTSLFPPPPNIFTGHDASSANNATEAQAEAGERWCAQYPLLQPFAHSPTQPPPRLLAPNANTFKGTITPKANLVWTVKTDRRCGDSCLTAQPPVYAAARDDPRVTGAVKTVYFEVKILKSLGDDAGVGIGFTALPYPGFRMPGWHRGSLAVHSDDGHKYVNDRWGGIDFVRPFGKAGVVGIGMRFSPGGGGADSKGKGASSIEVEAFFTMDGKVEGSWDVNGPLDAERDLAPIGVQGFHDLVVAVGMFEKTEIDVVLDPGKWVYKDVQV